MLPTEIVVAVITLGVVLRLFLPYFRKLLIQGQLLAFFKRALIGDLNNFNTGYLKQAIVVTVITLLTGTGIFSSVNISNYTISSPLVFAGFEISTIIAGDTLVLLSAFVYGYLGQSLPDALKKWKNALLDSKLIREGLMPDNIDPEIAQALNLQPKADN